jgi:hypothetical protein
MASPLMAASSSLRSPCKAEQQRAMFAQAEQRALICQVPRPLAQQLSGGGVASGGSQAMQGPPPGRWGPGRGDGSVGQTHDVLPGHGRATDFGRAPCLGLEPVEEHRALQGSMPPGSFLEERNRPVGPQAFSCSHVLPPRGDLQQDKRMPLASSMSRFPGGSASRGRAHERPVVMMQY